MWFKVGDTRFEDYAAARSAARKAAKKSAWGGDGGRSGISFYRSTDSDEDVEIESQIVKTKYFELMSGRFAYESYVDGMWTVCTGCDVATEEEQHEIKEMLLEWEENSPPAAAYVREMNVKRYAANTVMGTYAIIWYALAFGCVIAMLMSVFAAF